MGTFPRAGTKNEFLTDPYCCPNNDRELATFYGFVETTIIKSHIQMILAQRWDSPTLGHIAREVQWICNVKRIATKMM